MTLKQFTQLAAGVVVALIIYSLPVLPILKIPFAIISVISGVLIAFVPLEERPIDKWIIAFFKAIYSPTVYKWTRMRNPVVFAPESVIGETSQNIRRASELPFNLPQSGGKILSTFEAAEEAFFDKISQLYSQFKIPAFQRAAPAQTLVQPKQKGPFLSPQPRVRLITEEEKSVPQVSSKRFEELKPISITPSQTPPAKKEERHADTTLIPVEPVFGRENIDYLKNAVPAQFASKVLPPSHPNIVVGQVLTSDGKIIEDAILEIRDAQGKPVRALRTNKIGHFQTATPLENGTYEIEIEKEGFVFDKFKFIARGQIIEPIEIRAKDLAKAQRSAENLPATIM